jgi:hypothetical protein
MNLGAPCPCWFAHLSNVGLRLLLTQALHFSRFRANSHLLNLLLLHSPIRLDPLYMFQVSILLQANIVFFPNVLLMLHGLRQY